MRKGKELIINVREEKERKSVGEKLWGEESHFTVVNRSLANFE